jgi:hypothetical protein
VERRGQVTLGEIESTGNRRNSLSCRKAAVFQGWHEPDESRDVRLSERLGAKFPGPNSAEKGDPRCRLRRSPLTTKDTKPHKGNQTLRSSKSCREVNCLARRLSFVNLLRTFVSLCG